MADELNGVVLLACPECNKAVALYYHKGAVHQDLTNLDDHRRCDVCGNDMVDTERDADGRIMVPARVKDGSVTRERVKANAAP